MDKYTVQEKRGCVSCQRCIMAIVTYAYKVIWASVKTLEQDKLVNENHKYDMDKY